jgi:hypothetical protein
MLAFLTADPDPTVFRIRMFLGLPDPHSDPLVTSTDPDADTDADWDPSLFP